MLWKFIVNGSECENGAGHEFGVGAVAVFVELFVVSFSCKSGIMRVWGCSGGWNECEKVRVGLFMGDLVEKSQHSDVSTKVGGSEIVIEKRLRCGDVDGVEEGDLQVVNGLECCGRGVVNCAGRALKDWEDVRFKLIDERGSGVKGGRS